MYEFPEQRNELLTEIDKINKIREKIEAVLKEINEFMRKSPNSLRKSIICFWTSDFLNNINGLFKEANDFPQKMKEFP